MTEREREEKPKKRALAIQQQMRKDQAMERCREMVREDIETLKRRGRRQSSK